jgi:(+)-trans-carveol dehydrogenase
MSRRLKGQVALVTGAARAQGRSHAVRLAQEGADIVAVDLCAPIATVAYPLGSEDDLDQVNLSGVWRTYRASINHIRAGKRGGSVIITSSAAGLRALPNAAHYAAAKHGLVGMMKVLALELGPENIRVNTGMVQNAATMALFLPDPDIPRTEESFARIARTLNVLPVPWIEADVVSELVVFLACSAGRFITGAAIPIDAGMAVRW